MLGLIVDPTDKIWKLYLTLKEVTELICSPKISYQQIAYLDVLLKDYVDRRQKHFPTISLKPKHHYLIHYAQLMLKFGPLIKLWTMRMESKHSFFKNVARSAKCFKNITGTLSEKHQLSQAYRYSDIYAHEHIVLTSPQPLSLITCSTVIKLEIERHNLTGHILTASSAEYLGIVYKSSMIVFLKSLCDDGIQFCQIKLILKHQNSLYFIVAKCDAFFLSEYGIYSLVLLENNIMCIHVSELLHFYPLPLYHIGGCLCFFEAFNFKRKMTDFDCYHINIIHLQY